MRRRPLLRAGVGAAALAVGAPAATSASADGYEPLGSVEVQGAAEAVVGDDGDTVYLAAADGFATVDVSDPAEPAVLAERRGLLGDEYPSLSGILDVDVAGDRLVVPGPAEPGSTGEFHGFVLYDVSDPADPVPASEPYETEFHIHNCFFDGDHLYLAGNDGRENPLVVLDVADDEPQEVGRWSIVDRDERWLDVDWILRYLHDVHVRNGVAALPYWDAGTYLVDVSDPADPQYLSHVSEVDRESLTDVSENEVGTAQLSLPGNDHYAALDETGEVLAVGRESWAAESGDPEGAGGIDFWDVSEPSEPERLSTIDAPETHDASYRGGRWTTSHNFELREGRLYSSWYQGGVKIHDVSDPAEPEELAWWRDPATAAFWTARVATPDETFVASSTALIPGAGTAGALYTFPIEAGEQADPPSLTEPPDEGNESSRDGESDGNDEIGNESDEGEDGEDADETERENESESENESDESDDSTPGFTPIGALAGGTLALEWIRRRSTGGGGEGDANP